jgi:hypothetical protein
MAKFSLSANSESDSNVVAITLKMDPFNGDVEIDVVPKTRALILLAVNKSKGNPRSRRQVRRDPENPKRKIIIEADETAAFMEELADLLIRGWRGVLNEDGTPADCTRENKILLFNNIKVSSYLLEVSEDLGGAAEEDEEGK